MNVSSEYLNAICEGCLSPDRQLTAEITEVAIKKVFYEILHETVVEGVENLTLRLCLECKSNIQRFLSFKRQVREAHDILNLHLETSLLESYYNLLSHRPHLLPNELRLLLKSQQNLAKLETEVNDQPETTLNQTCDEPVLHQPVTFIKVEDDAVDDTSYLDDGYIQDDGDDKDLTPALSLDNKEPIKITIKTKHKRKNKTEDDFNDSDEEPLKNKKARKVREKRVKKNNDPAAPKIDRRKHPAPKKEKPAGVVDNPRVQKKLQQLNVGPGQLEMVVLSWEEVEAERQKALTSEVFTRHKYKCYDCIVGFNHRFKLENHMKKHDESAGDLVCTVCKVRCRGAHALGAHRRRHRVRWRCVRCGACLSRACVAADHTRRAHHAPPPTHTCATCGHTHTSLGKLRNHLKTHGEKQKCELCGKMFRDKTALRMHLFIHQGEKEYSCPRCDKKFLFKKAMEVHLETHNASAHLYCYECDLNFKNRMSYTQHMKYSLKHIDPAKLKYACHLCDKKFIKASRLEEHNLAVHLKVTPISCTIEGCNFACSSRTVLRTHIRMIHRNGRALRNHVCDACGKTYTTKKTLEGHLRSHTGERPFKCTLCPSTFGYEAALYNHNKLVHLKAKFGRNKPQTHVAAPTNVP